MPPPEEPLPLPRPKPKPKPPKPKQPKPEPVRDQTATGGVPSRPDPVRCAVNCSATCALYKYCPPPPPPPPAVAVSRAANVHLRSARLPTPLIALSASLLVVSVVLLLTLLICHLARKRRRRRMGQAEAPLTAHHHGGGDMEGVPVAVAGVEEDGEGGVHHVWYIRTVGLDERAISAITALVYDAKKCGVELGGGAGGDGGAGCAVCLADFRDGETLRLLPRCRHAFHRGCIDTWLRAHVNCPLCRAPVQPVAAAAANAMPGAATVAPSGHPSANPRAMAASETGRAEADAMPERAVRRAASMVALPRRDLPADASLLTPASNSRREGETGLAKATRLMKFSEVLEMAGVGVGRSVSFGAASGGPARRQPAPAPTRCHRELLDAAATVTMRD